MTLEEAEEFLFFLRDEMLKKFQYDAETVYRIPGIALNDKALGRLVRAWFETTQAEVRNNVEASMIKYVEDVNGTSSN